MNTPIWWNATASRIVTSVARPKWEEVRRGLSRAALGYVCLFALVVPGLLLVRPAPPGGRSFGPLGLDADVVNTFGWILAVAGTFLGYLLLLSGQWRCLSSAPVGHGTKRCAFACLLCSLLAPVCLGGAHLFGGSENWDALRRGPAGIADLTLFRGTGLLQAAGACLGLLSVLLFSGYLRGVARCQGDEERVRGIACFVGFASFLIGSTVGLFLHARSSALAVSWAVLALGWGVSLLWHLVLILAASRGIQRVLLRKKSTATLPPLRDQGQVALRVASLMRRAEHSRWPGLE